MLPTTSSISFDTLLDRLTRGAGDEHEALTPEQLYTLSDLTGREAEQLRTRWADIPVQRRLAVVRQLTDAAQEELTLHLGRLLRVALNDDEGDIRRLAIESLWEETSDDLVGPLLRRLLNDEASSVRAAAARALGSYVLAGELEELNSALDARVEEALLSVVHNRTEMLEVRRYALESLAYSSEMGVRYLIEDAYYSPYEEMRQSALVAMGRSADVRWRSLVQVELGNPSPEIRAEAAWACGELEAQQALGDLLLLLEDEEAQVRLAAIAALGRIGGSEATEALRFVAASGEADLDEAEREVMQLDQARFDESAITFSAEEVAAAELALEELSFYNDAGDITLLDEEADELGDNGFDDDGFWYDLDDRSPGTYE